MSSPNAKAPAKAKAPAEAKTPAKSIRNALLRAIHTAARNLGLITANDRSAYEDMLWTLARVRSASDLDDFALRTVLDHLNDRPAKRWTPPFKRGSQQALMGVLWSKLKKAKLVKDGSTGALRAWAKPIAERYHETAELEFLQPVVLAEMIERLKQWSARGGDQ